MGDEGRYGVAIMTQRLLCASILSSLLLLFVADSRKTSVYMLIYSVFSYFCCSIVCTYAC